MRWLLSGHPSESAGVQGASSRPLSPPGGPALLQLERSLDSGPWPALGRAASLWREQRRRRASGLRAERLPDVSDASSPSQLVEALRCAMAAGALESAGHVVERLEALSPAHCETLPQGAPALLVEALLMLGERHKAAELARRYHERLTETANGLSMLELLGLADGTAWLPNGRPNVLRLSRQLASGALDAEGLAVLLEGRPWLWLQVPELHLLFFSALREQDRARALRFLNRFLALHGPSRCRWSDTAQHHDNVLASLLFEPEPPLHGGPLVSVLMAVHNAAHTVAYAVDSLLGQTYEPLEILICDDASQDGTLALLRSRYAAERRVRLFRSTENQGAYNVRNALAQRARGGLLTFHDADDLALPGRIARQVEQLRRPGVVGCVTSLLRVTPDGGVVFFKNQKATRLCLVSLMLTRQAFEAAGPFRSARVGADWELYCQVRARFGVAAISRIAAPALLVLWSSSSATRAEGTESLEDGYRSPARRIYSELVYAQTVPGAPRLPGQEVVGRLRASGNFVERRDIVEVE